MKLDTQDERLSYRIRSESVRFVKNRQVLGRQLCYVTCDAEGHGKGQTYWHWSLLVTKEEPGRWSATGVAGGSGESPVVGYPWANLGGSWGRDGFRAGGTVEDAGRSVARVTLTDSAGRTFEDTVENGVVLFFSDQPVAMPMRIDLYDEEGRVVRSDDWGSEDD